MSVTILEALQNADFNFQSNVTIAQVFAKDQLHNAVTLLDKGYGLYIKVEPLLEEFGNVDNVPEAEERLGKSITNDTNKKTS